MIDPKVLELRDIEHIIAPPAIRIDDAIWNHFALDYRHERG